MTISPASKQKLQTVECGHAQPDAPFPMNQDAIAAVAAAERLDVSESEYLISCACAKGATRQQLPGIIRQARTRLDRIREETSNILATPLPDRELTDFVTRASEALQAGPAFAPDTADRFFGGALALCSRVESVSAEINASIAGVQAEVAALRQDHRWAAELFARAAAKPGLSETVQWRLQFQRAAVLDELGREYGDDGALEQAVELYQDAVLPLAPRSERPNDWSVTQHYLGNALGILGQRGRGIRHLERSVAAFENALSDRHRDHHPLDWAASQHGLGNALGILAQRQGDSDLMERAVSCLQAAVEVRGRQAASAEWAQSAYHLGAALLVLGQVTRDASALSRSIDAFHQALQVLTWEREPLDWAKCQNSLGMALRVRGEQDQQGETGDLNNAVEAYQRALKIWTQEQWPEEWALTQNNLGAALQRLGERENSVDYLGVAAAAYENALQQLSRDNKPLVWAMTRANLGDVRQSLGELTRNSETAEKAVADFELVAAIFHDASHARYYELAKEQLAAARELAAELSVAR